MSKDNIIKGRWYDINKKIKQFTKIFNSYKRKYKQLADDLDKSLVEYFLTHFDKKDIFYNIEDRMAILENSRNKKGNYWRNFFFKASIYVEEAKKIDETAKSWVKLAPAKFRSYYNQEIYNLNVSIYLNVSSTRSSARKDR